MGLIGIIVWLLKILTNIIVLMENASLHLLPGIDNRRRYRRQIAVSSVVTHRNVTKLEGGSHQTVFPKVQSQYSNDVKHAGKNSAAERSNFTVGQYTGRGIIKTSAGSFKCTRWQSTQGIHWTVIVQSVRWFPIIYVGIQNNTCIERIQYFIAKRWKKQWIFQAIRHVAMNVKMTKRKESRATAESSKILALLPSLRFI